MVNRLELMAMAVELRQTQILDLRGVPLERRGMIRMQIEDSNARNNRAIDLLMKAAIEGVE